MQSPNSISTMPFTNPFFYQVQPDIPIAENSVMCNLNLGVNQYPNNGYYVWPMDLSNFTFYY